MFLLLKYILSKSLFIFNNFDYWAQICLKFVKEFNKESKLIERDMRHRMECEHFFIMFLLKERII